MAKRKSKEGLEWIFEGVLKKLPMVLESKALEAAEVCAIYLDKSTRKYLNKRSTGTLANSWQATLLRDGDGDYTAGAYSDLPYASIHERGGRIFPKQAKNLAIPITDKARNIGSPRNFPNLQYVSYNGISPRLIEMPSFTAQYVLRRWVDIPGTGYISKAGEAAKDDVVEIIGNGVSGLIASQARGASLMYEI